MLSTLASSEDEANYQHEKPIALALTLFITSLLSSCVRWFTARAPAQTRTKVATVRDATR